MCIYCIMSLFLYLSLSPCWLSPAARFTRWRALLPWRKWFWASFQCFGKSLSICPCSCFLPRHSVLVCMLRPLLLSQLPSLLTLSWGMTANNTCNVQVWRQILRARSQDFSVSHSNFDHSFVNRSLTSSLTFWEWSTKPLEDWYKFYAWSLI